MKRKDVKNEDEKMQLIEFQGKWLCKIYELKLDSFGSALCSHLTILTKNLGYMAQNIELVGKKSNFFRTGQNSHGGCVQVKMY